MARCKSTYQNRGTRGQAVGPVVRCTRDEGHPLENEPREGWRELHEWLRPGRRVRWPDSAAESTD